MHKRIPLLIITLITGCASTPEPKQTPEPKVIESKQERVTRNLTLSWDNIGRGGAAIRQPAHVHVLGQGNINEFGSKASIPKTDTTDLYIPKSIAEAVDAIDNVKKENIENSGYSLYELSRWERFCDDGKGMDEIDWRFVKRNGGKANIPNILQDSCTAPDHDYKAYLIAWTSFCTGTDISSFQRKIVRESVRPKSYTCAALSK